jgi:hypothetical protein
VSDLEQTLQAVGRELDYPAAPALAGEVLRSLAGQPPRHRPSQRRRAVALGLALSLLSGTAAVAAVPDARNAVLDWLGLRSVQVRRVPVPPVVPKKAVSLDLGQRTSLQTASASVRFRVLVPGVSSPGSPAVYRSQWPAGGRVSLVYEPRPGLPRAVAVNVGMLITEFQGEQPVGFIQKSLGPGTTAQELTIDGDPAVWIAGRPHTVVFLDAHGVVREDTMRLAGNTLLWHRGQVLIRIEANLSERAAIRVARSMR